MPTTKVAITIRRELLERLDRLVRERVYPNRSQAIQEAVREKLRGLDQGRLARECAKLDPELEQTMTEEGVSTELAEWPEY